MIAAHRVERDPHGLLLLGFFNDDGFPALGVVPAAVPADEVRPDRVRRSGAVGVLADRQMLMTRRLPWRALEVRLFGTAMILFAFVDPRESLRSARGVGNTSCVASPGMSAAIPGGNVV